MNGIHDLLSKPFRIVDISQPIKSDSACFPGDTPFSREVTVSHQESQVINLTALTMSPHVGTHVDAPVHVRGSMDSNTETVGSMSLDPFVGLVEVIDIAPFVGAIKPEHIEGHLKTNATRLLIRTSHQIRYQVFEDSYAFLSTEVVDWLYKRGTRLVGLDSPSVDDTQSKTLCAHHGLLARDIFWLENLDLTAASCGEYFLVAAPLKFMELEASPVRALLLDWSTH
ncbi:MAG: cyclase family protein [Cyanobacteria bacterium SZAS-4]|nr:cyclase family protein [Cyanobacteria bacterium SZAS-4]